MSDTDIVTRLRGALATELFRIVASGRCEKDGTRLVDGRCSWCEMFDRDMAPVLRARALLASTTERETTS